MTILDLWLAFGFLSVATALAAKPVVLAMAEKDGLYGCIDLQGNAVIPFIYNEIGLWSEGRMAVSVGGVLEDYEWKGCKWGFCDPRGKLVIPAQFDETAEFAEGLAPVRIGEKWGYIDRNGKWVVKPTYEAAGQFSEGLAAVQLQGCWGFIDKQGKLAIEPLYDREARFEGGSACVFLGHNSQGISEEIVDDFGFEGHFGIIDRQGQWIIPPSYLSLDPFRGGLAKAGVRDPKDAFNLKFGYLEKTGKWAIPPIYDHASPFEGGRAMVGFRDVENNVRGHILYDYRYGLIDTSGRQVLPIEYGSVTRTEDGHAVVRKEPRRLVAMMDVDESGKILNPEDWPTSAIFDQAGGMVLPFGRFREIQPLGCGGLYLASRAGFAGTGVIDLQGNTILDFRYAHLGHLGDEFLRHDLGARGDGVGVIDLAGKELFSSKEFEMPASKFAYGIIGVRTENLSKSGFVNLKGEFVIPPVYEMIWNFEVVEE